MKNHEQLPAIDENVLDGVAGGMSDASLRAAERAVNTGTGVAQAAAKLPFNIAGAAANFAGDIYGSISDFMHQVGTALTGGGSK